MGAFNALIAVKVDATRLDANLAIELERLLRPWMPGRFDWYAIGVTSWRGFAAYLHPSRGWLDKGDEFSLDDIPSGYALVPIRCHD